MPCIVAAAAEKPRIFVTESGAVVVTGDSAFPGPSYSGGTSPQNVEVMKAFTRYCPGVVVTSNRDKADYVVRLDHEGVNPTTPFVHGNKVAVFDRQDDLVFSNSTRTLANAVKGACGAILKK